MLKGKRAVFLDAGFTLVEPTLPIADVYFREALALGIDLPKPVFDERLKEAWPRIVLDYRSRHPDLETSEELEREAWRLFTRAIASGFPALLDAHEVWLARLFAHFDGPAAWRPIDGAREAIDRMVDAGLVVGVVSNWHGSLHSILEGHGLNRRLSFVITSAEAGRKKPHASIFRQALERAAVLPDESIHVGDSWEEDVEGARAMGIAAIHFDPAGLNVGKDAAPRLAKWSDLIVPCA